MFRPASRALLRAPVAAAGAPGRIRVAQSSRRLISTAPPDQKSRSWKSSILRLGLAVGAVYYYNTSSVFAEEPAFSLRPQPEVEEEANTPTLDAIKPKRRQQQQQLQQPAAEPVAQTDAQNVVAVEGTAEPSEGLASPEELEQQAGQEGAFNPETGEINWDCPCLGGMAHGPCGEEFKAAFSCFVYSSEEPKGMDCIEKFKGMQDCFRQHPDVYGAELDEDEVDAQLEDHIASSSDDSKSTGSPATQIDASSSPDEKRARAKEVHSQTKAAAAQSGEQPESDELVPKAAHDAQNKNATTNPTEK